MSTLLLQIRLVGLFFKAHRSFQNNSLGNKNVLVPLGSDHLKHLYKQTYIYLIASVCPELILSSKSVLLPKHFEPKSQPWEEGPKMYALNFSGASLQNSPTAVTAKLSLR